ncbi:MAG: type VI secretion system tip protein VgrG [Holophagales bacterium]|nr:type VI secretion system tip protein VgrG [Holophagales bacterium]
MGGPGLRLEGKNDGRVSAAETQAPRHDAARRERAPPEGVRRGRGDLDALLLPAGDDRREQDEGPLRRAPGAEADDPHAAAGRVERDAPQRPLRPCRAGGTGRDVHGLRGGDRPRRLEADAKVPEPHLPASDRPRDPQEGLQGFRRRLAAEREVRAPRLLRPVPGDRLQLRRTPHGRGRDLLLLQARRRQPPDDRLRQRPRAPGPAGGEQDHLRGDRGGTRDENRIWAWKKEQEMRPGKYLLWDHSFELPHKHLEAEALIHDSVPVGKETHKLKVAGVDQLEVYDFPGEYAQRFDGINAGGGEQPAELQKIFRDNQRTVELRMDEETTPAIVIRAKSNVKHLVSGFKFTLQRHFNADGDYVVTGVRHQASFGADYRSGKDVLLTYENEVTCIPVAVAYRPRRTTPKPVVQGSQTAVVVGPSGEEIFTDKYGRVKVQFHWDREGKNDENSSCWIRVGTSWAGRNWGAIRIPRIGHEVIVDFLEGDPDQPIVVGSVYNADMIPPYELPKNKTQSGVKSRSSLGGTPANFNEIRFEDLKGKEEFYQHAERNLTTVVENDEGRTVGGNRGTGIGGNDSRKVGKNDTHEIKGYQTTDITGYQKLDVGQYRKTGITSDDTITVGGSEEHTVTKVFQVTAKNIFLIAEDQLLIGVGGSTICITSGRIEIHSGGAIETKGKTVDALAEDRAKVKGGRVIVESASTVDVTANGPVSIKGAVVKLNA